MCLELDGTRSDLGVVCLLVAVLDLTFDGDALFLYQTVKESRVSHYDLKCAVHVAEVDEGYSAVVSDVLDPAADAELGTDVLLGKFT